MTNKEDVKKIIEIDTEFCNYNDRVVLAFKEEILRLKEVDKISIIELLELLKEVGDNMECMYGHIQKYGIKWIRIGKKRFTVLSNVIEEILDLLENKEYFENIEEEEGCSNSGLWLVSKRTQVRYRVQICSTKKVVVMFKVGNKNINYATRGIYKALGALAVIDESISSK